MVARIIAVMLIASVGAAPLQTLASGSSEGIAVAKLEESSYPFPKPDISRELKIRDSYQFYDIQGNSVAELKREMRQKGTKWNDGKTYAAITTWDLKYDYDIVTREGGYAFSSVSTDLGIVFHLPRRLESATAAKELAAQWEKYMEHLRVHENGHKDLAVKAATEITQKLAALGTFPTKSELKREAERIVTTEMKRMKALQVAYDADTEHGVKQGAIMADEH